MSISSEHFGQCAYCEKLFTKNSHPKIEFSVLQGNNEIQDNKFCSINCYDDFKKAKQIIFKIVYESIKDYYNKI